jgi:hypothetical protein
VAPTAQFDLVGSVLANHSGMTYSYDSGSFYKLTSGAITWANANTAASATSLFGQVGHLLHVNSAAEQAYIHGASGYNGVSGWLGGSDQAVEGTWRWYYGATAGEAFMNGSTSYGGALNGAFNFVGGNEPNGNASSDEDFLAKDTYPNGGWADYSAGATLAGGYLTEFEGSAILNRQTYVNTGTVKVNSTEAGQVNPVASCDCKKTWSNPRAICS